jgi:transcriptional regulator with XRE-family HTH domain
MWNDSVMRSDGQQARASSAELSRLIGERIRNIRLDRGWSLSAVAAQAAVGKATLSEIEAGVRNPTLETLYAIAAILQVPLTDLLRPSGRSGEVHPSVRGKAVTATLVEVFDDPSITTEVYRLAIRPGAEQVSPGHGPGVLECLLLESGAAAVGPRREPLIVRSGEQVTWDSSGPHCYRAIGDQLAQGILIIRHPRAAAASTSPSEHRGAGGHPAVPMMRR